MFLNINAVKKDFADQPEIFIKLYKSGWDRQGKDEAIAMAKDQCFACPTDEWTFGQSIFDAIAEHFGETT